MQVKYKVVSALFYFQADVTVVDSSSKYNGWSLHGKGVGIGIGGASGTSNMSLDVDEDAFFSEVCFGGTAGNLLTFSDGSEQLGRISVKGFTMGIGNFPVSVKRG
jgi:hypothetical protein